MALLDSKTRIIDSQFTRTGKYFLLRGADPQLFSPINLASPYFDKEGFSLAATTQLKVSPLSAQDAPPGLTVSGSPISSSKRFWARIIKANGEELSSFGKGWHVLTEYEDHRAGLVDLVRSIVDGEYNSRVAPWEAGSLVSSEDEIDLVLNGAGNELRHVWEGFGSVGVKEAEEIVRPDLLAQSEFSRFINGMHLPPTVKDGQGNEMPLRVTEDGSFQTNRLTPRSIRNRLISGQVQSLEVEVEPKGLRTGTPLSSKWIPVERRRFSFRFDGNEFIVETAQQLDVIQFDANLFFVGKIVPVAMQDRLETTTNAFLRIFTVVFEDGT